MDKVTLFIHNNITQSDRKKEPSFDGLFNAGQIAYFLKIVAFVEFFNLEYENKSCLLFINKLRNEASHRNSLTTMNEDETLVEFIGRNIDIEKNIDRSILSDDDVKLYYKGIYIRDRRKKDFNRVIFNIEKLKENIVEDLEEL